MRVPLFPVLAGLATLAATGCARSSMGPEPTGEPEPAGLPAPGEGCLELELRFTPTARAQMAIWLQSGDGERFQTLLLTEAVGERGIGNRPGAMQLNSGFRWPYGRRETVLPLWATRRLEAGGMPFRRVVYQERPEGFVTRQAEDHSPDDYFCLSFDESRSQRDGLDAVSCASSFFSDKGRYLKPDESDYLQPVQVAGMGLMDALDPMSAYPPRRDVERCEDCGCFDHADVADFNQDALDAMPELDAVTRATLAAEPAELRFEVDEDWLQESPTVLLEIHTEGDYNGNYNPDLMPTPSLPEGEWGKWASSYGYPYRGQPSVVFEVPFLEEGTPRARAAPVASTLSQDGDLLPLPDPTVTDDPEAAPGSGADRLRAVDDGTRLRAVLRRGCQS